MKEFPKKNNIRIAPERRDRFVMQDDDIETLTPAQAAAYEKWLDETPEVSSTEGVASEYVLDDDKAEDKESKKPRKARRKKTT